VPRQRPPRIVDIPTTLAESEVCAALERQEVFRAVAQPFLASLRRAYKQ
jgi:hypothetical protein